MPGKGSVPKQRPLGHRRRTVQPLQHDGVLRGPELPREGPDGVEWHPMTVDWWVTWRGSAQAQLFTSTDWSQLIDCAALHHVMWTHQRLELANEIRLRSAKFGETPEDRLRQRIAVDGEEL